MRTIAVTGGKGGVGKSILTINLAYALNEFNKRVLIIDADIKSSSLGLQLGMHTFPVTLNDILDRRANILQALYIHPSGIRLISASLSASEANLSMLKEVLHDNLYEDIILVDSPPGFEDNAISVMKACDEILIVTIPEAPAIADAMKTILIAQKINCHPIGIVINKFDKTVEQIAPKEIESICGLQILGVIPDDKSIQKSIFKKIPVVQMNPYSQVSIGFKKLAAKIAGVHYQEPKGLSLKRILRRFL